MKITRSQLQRLITETLEEMNDLPGYLGTDDFMDAEDELAARMDAQDDGRPRPGVARIKAELSRLEGLKGKEWAVEIIHRQGSGSDAERKQVIVVSAPDESKAKAAALKAVRRWDQPRAGDAWEVSGPDARL